METGVEHWADFIFTVSHNNQASEVAELSSSCSSNYLHTYLRFSGYFNICERANVAFQNMTAWFLILLLGWPSVTSCKWNCIKMQTLFLNSNIHGIVHFCIMLRPSTAGYEDLFRILHPPICFVMHILPQDYSNYSLKINITNFISLLDYGQYHFHLHCSPLSAKQNQLRQRKMATQNITPLTLFCFCSMN